MYLNIILDLFDDIPRKDQLLIYYTWRSKFRMHGYLFATSSIQGFAVNICLCTNMTDKNSLK